MRPLLCTIFALMIGPAALGAEAKFPAPEFRTGYQLPQVHVSHAQGNLWNYIDTALLAVALSAAAWLVFKKRSRRGVLILMLLSLAYFGFFRKGCICPVGSVQNVAMAMGDPGYALPWVAAAFFLLPLAFTLFFGRVFCAGVCPLGAIQDAVLWRPIQLPLWLEQALGLFAYIYLGLAVLFAYTGSDFLICRYDPFVGFFRLSAPANILFLGVLLLVLGMFVGRIYCRFICPYSVLLKLLSIFSKRQVSITPKDCVDCRLCEQACPFGAIRYPTPRQTSSRRDPARRQLAITLLLSPFIIGAMTYVGYIGRGALSRMDTTVRLAERVYQEESGAVAGVTDESKAFRLLGQPPEQLYRRAAAIQRRLAIGSSLFGAWIGLVVQFKLAGLLIRRRRTGYSADPAGCVACARCYISCPVEKEMREKEAAFA